MIYPVVVLAGGLGTRLRPLTLDTPKVLVEVAHKPFVIHLLKLLKENNINRVVMCLGHYGSKVRDVIEGTDKHGLDIVYSFDGASGLGTGGAIKRALRFVESSFFVLYGDTYLPIDFNQVQRAFESSSKLALMTVYKNTNLLDKSNVYFYKNHLIQYSKRIYNPKMEHIDYGLAVIQRAAFEAAEGLERFDLADLYENLASRGQLDGYEVYERFYEIGSHSGLRDANDYLENKEKNDGLHR